MLRRWIRSLVPERLRRYLIQKVAGASLAKKDSTIESLRERVRAAERSRAEVAADLAVSASEIEKLRATRAEREAQFHAKLKEAAAEVARRDRLIREQERVRAEQSRASTRGLLEMLPDDLPALHPASASAKHHAQAMSLRYTLRSQAEFDHAAERFLATAAVSGNTDGLRPLMQAFAQAKQTKEFALAPADFVDSLSLMDVDNFTQFVSGKTIALVANSPSLLESGLGDLIDSYDLVMRFNSFITDPLHTGTRTDIHAAFHLYDSDLNAPVSVRILLGEKYEPWLNSLKLRLQPGAQTYVGDASLRWPVREPGLIVADSRFKLATASFNMVCLLMHLGVSKMIDLIGYNFCQTGILRLPDAPSIPNSLTHNLDAERDWILEQAVSCRDNLVSMMAATHD